ncbi:MAG: response regulator transcription factor [Eubacterium sp.]|nr:response regulator transcription factor [Eubacterium sp.]
MSVLILEDNRQILKVLEELVLSVSDEKVYATDDVGEAYKIAMENSVDVFLLDIILYADKKGDTSGMQYAQCVRTLERYRFTPIIFITSLEDPEMYALRDLHAFGYIEKPFDHAEVERLLRDALHFKTQKASDAMMFFRKDGILYPVKCNQVLYIEMVKRKICIHLKDGDRLNISYKSLREILEEANYDKFVQCSRNCIVNIEYIKNIDKTNRFITLKWRNTVVEMGGTFIKKIEKVLGI